jgi:hypothetical protein
VIREVCIKRLSVHVEVADGRPLQPVGDFRGTGNGSVQQSEAQAQWVKLFKLLGCVAVDVEVSLNFGVLGAAWALLRVRENDGGELLAPPIFTVPTTPTLR